MVFWMAYDLWTADDPAQFFTNSPYNFSLGTPYPSQRKITKMATEGEFRTFLNWISKIPTKKYVPSYSEQHLRFIPLKPPSASVKSIRNQNSKVTPNHWILFLDIYFDIWWIECCTPLRIGQWLRKGGSCAKHKKLTHYSARSLLNVYLSLLRIYCTFVFRAEIWRCIIYFNISFIRCR